MDQQCEFITKTSTTKGNIVDNLQQPYFLADPSHQIKMTVNPTFNIIVDVKDPERCNNGDAT